MGGLQEIPCAPHHTAWRFGRERRETNRLKLAAKRSATFQRTFERQLQTNSFGIFGDQETAVRREVGLPVGQIIRCTIQPRQL